MPPCTPMPPGLGPALCNVANSRSRRTRNPARRIYVDRVAIPRPTARSPAGPPVLLSRTSSVSCRLAAPRPGAPPGTRCPSPSSTRSVSSASDPNSRTHCGRLPPDARTRAGCLRGRAAPRSRYWAGRPVARHHGIGIDPAELDTPRGVDTDVVADQLECVAIARRDQHLGPSSGLRGRVAIRSSASGRARRTGWRAHEHLPMRSTWPRKSSGVGCGWPCIGAARPNVCRDVEAHREVGGAAVAQEVDEHGCEAVDRAGLPCAGAEVLRAAKNARQVECPSSRAPPPGG